MAGARLSRRSPKNLKFSSWTCGYMFNLWPCSSTWLWRARSTVAGPSASVNAAPPGTSTRPRPLLSYCLWLLNVKIFHVLVAVPSVGLATIKVLKVRWWVTVHSRSSCSPSSLASSRSFPGCRPRRSPSTMPEYNSSAMERISSWVMVDLVTTVVAPCSVRMSRICDRSACSAAGSLGSYKLPSSGAVRGSGRPPNCGWVSSETLSSNAASVPEKIEESLSLRTTSGTWPLAILRCHFDSGAMAPMAVRTRPSV